MALTQSTPGATTNNTQSSHVPDKISLPPPQTFDILPPLHELIARIDHSSSDPLTASAQETVTYTDSKPLEPKDFPNEVQSTKAKIRKALRELEKLPDMERSVEEQEVEIAEVEERIRRQREELGGLMEVARGLEESGGK